MNLRRLLSEPLLWAVLAVPLAFLVCLCFGAVSTSPWDLLHPSEQLRPIVDLRMQRLLCAFVVGGALSMSGAAYQAALRNPLAEPFILGVSGGASLGAALAIASGLAALSSFFIPAFSFIGAVLILGAVLRMAYGGAAGYANNIALSGVVAGSVCSSVLMFIISVSGSHEMNSITWWMLGSLQPTNAWLLWGMFGLSLAGCATFFAFGRETDAMTLGSETAYHLGVSPKLLLGVLLGVASLLTAFSVALSGIIGFVGLVIPHLLRKLFGAGHRRLFPLSLLCGGIFLMLCDTIARTILGSMELPVGVISSFIGGPFFLWVLNARRIRE